MVFALRFPKAEITRWLNRYSPDGDRDSLAIGDLSRKAGYYSKEDFVRVCDWKTRGRPRRHYLQNTEEEVRKQTHVALTDPDEGHRMRSLTALRGVGLPTASMLLQLAYPDFYPVIDFRALWSLKCEQKHFTVDFWLEYVHFCRKLARECGISSRHKMRDLDRALWEYSRANQPTKKGITVIA